MHSSYQQQIKINLFLLIVAGTIATARDLRGHQDVCKTHQCMKSAELLKASMNTSVDPCENFYEFACGGWIQSNKLNSGESLRNRFSVLEETVYGQLKGLLEEEPTETEVKGIPTAKRFYKACLNDDDFPADERMKTLYNTLWEFGGWPIIEKSWDESNFNWSWSVAEHIKRTGVTPLLNVFVYFDLKNTSQYIITVDQPQLGLDSSMLLAPDSYLDQVLAYVNWVLKSAMEVSKHINLEVNMEDLVAESNLVVKFEAAVARLMTPRENRRNASNFYNHMSIKDLQSWANKFDDNEPSSFQALEFFNNIFENTGIKLNGDEVIAVREPSYISGLLELLNKTPKRVIANYINWRFITQISSDVSINLRKIAFQYEQVLTGAQSPKERWTDCIFLTTNLFKHSVGYLYTSKYFDKETKLKVKDIVNNIKKTFINQVHSVEWMDDVTLKTANEKAAKMIDLVAYPDMYDDKSALDQLDFEIEITSDHFLNLRKADEYVITMELSKLQQQPTRAQWFSSASEVNAYYNVQTNAITLPAGILQEPFYSEETLGALNYGSIGVMIGHEITHGFDDIGRQADENGNLIQWWSTSTSKTYLEKTKCFIEKYSAFTVNELGAKTVNGEITQGENIADNGGLHEAFMAYQKYIEMNGQEPLLPMFEEYTTEQLYFLGFASAWCETTTTQHLLQEILKNSHSPNRFRVLGTLTNSKDFADIWKCPLGSPMNPANKCVIW